MANKEPYKPWMRSLLNRMKELYNKPDAKTIAEALPEVSGGGGEVTPASIVTATGQMNNTQKEQTLDNIGGEPKKLAITFTKSGSAYSADKTYAQINTAYQAGADIVFYYDGTAALATFFDAGTANVFQAEICRYGNNGPELVLLAVTENDNVAGNAYPLEKSPMLTTVSEATPSIIPANNTIYKCGTLTSLTVLNPPATGAYSIVFTSGATATTTTIPADILGLEDFSAEANTMYEINVLDNRAVVGSWAVSST